ncbi:hypothetical protein NSK_002117 [Nannochloropsis salina CCMP1776]|uniref:MRG domain-containing protein n=1 Tax=Nannochloropsis salina CCMP1776 TaxID=1027361 RepID=A0A4D9D4U0_9STRA|nr:hypothetical protein NSK_002117 [Nannochloropsis salina CCMP1776]|eukprot:TFJ86460.1 hypothetical protein NSK_002117 [Nannochloropsis salina CCMP1776]
MPKRQGRSDGAMLKAKSSSKRGRDGSVTTDNEEHIRDSHAKGVVRRPRAIHAQSETSRVESESKDLGHGVDLDPVTLARPSRAAASTAKARIGKTFEYRGTGGNAIAEKVPTNGEKKESKPEKAAARQSGSLREAPHRLELVADRHSKGALLDALIRIKPPDVLMKAFKWSSRNDKYFALTVFSAKGNRILPQLLKEVPLRYRIASVGARRSSETTSKETGAEEVLYDEAGKATHGGMYYFRVPQFEIPGCYSISFQLQGPAAFNKLDPVSQIVTVVPADALEHTGPFPPRAVENESRALPTGTLRSLRSQRQGAEGSASNAAVGRWSTRDPALGGEGNFRVQHSLEKHLAASVKEDTDSMLTFDELWLKGQLLTLVIPGALRQQLCEDWFAVTRRRCVVGALPRHDGKKNIRLGRQTLNPQWPSVGEVVRMYERSIPAASLGDFKGLGGRLCTLFDGALGNVLLYRFEMDQYLSLLELGGNSKLPHQIWGAEHLLRLLAIAPRLLGTQKSTSTKKGVDEESSNTLMDSEAPVGMEVERPESREIEVARTYLQGLLDFLETEQASLFASYVEPPGNFGLEVPRNFRPS